MAALAVGDVRRQPLQQCRRNRALRVGFVVPAVLEDALQPVAHHQSPEAPPPPKSPPPPPPPQPPPGKMIGPWPPRRPAKGPPPDTRENSRPTSPAITATTRLEV